MNELFIFYLLLFLNDVNQFICWLSKRKKHRRQKTCLQVHLVASFHLVKLTNFLLKTFKINNS